MSGIGLVNPLRWHRLSSTLWRLASV